MKKMDLLRLLLLSLLTKSIYADMPQPGLYGGALFGFTWSSSISDPVIIPFIEKELKRDGFIAKIIQEYILNYRKSLSGRDFELDYSVLGQIGGQIGYRFQNVRLEGQFFYNVSPYRKFRVNGPFKEFEFSANNTQSNYITGNTNTAAGMLNIYYDFLQLPVKWIEITPFVGVGGGYANVTNNLKIYKDGSAINNQSISPNGSHFAGQLMAGLLYFIDEFSTIGIDYRYFTTATQTVKILDGDSSFRNQVQSVNLTLNGAFNFG